MRCLVLGVGWVWQGGRSEAPGPGNRAEAVGLPPTPRLLQTYLVWNGSGTPWEQPSWLDLDLQLSGLGQVRTPEETAALCSLFWMKLTAGVAGTRAATWELGEDAAGTYSSPGRGWGASHHGQARGFWEQTVFTQVTAPLSPRPVQLFFP